MRKNTHMSAMIPMQPTAMSDAWDLGTETLEIWSAAFSTISSRTHLWQTQSPFDPKMMRENEQMVSEKLSATWEVGVEIQKAWMGMLSGDHGSVFSASRSVLKPIHRHTVANSKRLAR